MPKQLLPLAGVPNESLLAATARRLEPLVSADRVYVVTGARLAESTRQALPLVPPSQILAEPAPRNTAPCVAWAVATLLRREPGATVAVLPSDHFIGDEPAFRTAVSKAEEIASRGYLVTIGIVPTRPETGYGYVEVGDKIASGAVALDAFVAARFVEKPDRARAEAFVSGGRHLWNAGMFFFRAEVMAQAFEKHLPEVWRGILDIDAAARHGRESEVLGRVFPTLHSVSIDHGVMEKADRVAVVPGRFGWNDVGSWESAWELAKKDGADNAVPAGSITIDARGNYVCDRTTSGSKRVYALVGVKDLVLVETDDAVLVIPRDRAQDVRSAVEALKKRNDGRL
jgi:mannose-1-phosphate guanylyltransferase